MILALVGAGALLALAGTRLAAAPLLAAAVLAGFESGPWTVPATWTAGLATGLLAIGVPPRRLALPLGGAAAVLLAGAAANAASVLPAWVAASAAAALANPRARSFTLGVLVGDLALAAGVIWAAATGGFAAWPPELTGPGVLVVGAALARAPLCSGADDRVPEAGLLIVRTQAAVLVFVGVGSGELAAQVAVIGGAAMLLAGSLAARAGARDATGEVGLLAILVGGATLGWMPPGWAWGALAAGTFLHLVRIGGRGAEQVRVGRDLLRTGAWGSPLLVPFAAAAAGAVVAGGALGAVVLAALAAGAGLRVVATGRETATRGFTWPPLRPLVAGFAALGGAFAVLAPLGPLAGVEGTPPVPWPGGWAVALVVAGGVGALLAPHRLAPARAARPPGPDPVGWPGWVTRAGDVAERGTLVGVAFGVLAVAAVGVWLSGWLRGFL